MISLKKATNPPQHVKEKIDQQYTVVQQATWYPHSGHSSYTYKIGPSYSICSDNILQLLVNNAKGNQVNVLDIGTGDGLFVLENNKHPHIQCYGISATDMRPDPAYPNNNFYIIGDAHKLADIPALKELKFDCIFSKTTFLHLADPIGAIVQAYEKLKVGGWLIIDEIPLTIYHGNLACYSEGVFRTWLAAIALILELRKSGYIVTAVPSDSGLSSFLLKKTNDEPLEFPLDYSSDANEVVYLPSFQISNTLIEQQYQNGKAIVSCKINNNNALNQQLHHVNAPEHLKIAPGITASDMIFIILYNHIRFQNINVSSILQKKPISIAVTKIILSSINAMRLITVVSEAVKPNYTRELDRTSMLGCFLPLTAMLDIIDLGMFNSEIIPFMNVSNIEDWKQLLYQFFSTPEFSTVTQSRSD